MDTALSEINSLLSTIVPFDTLPDDVLEQTVKLIKIDYLLSGRQLPPKGHVKPQVYIVRKGALSYHDKDGQLLGKYGEGDVCTVFCSARQAEKISVKTEEDTLLYCLELDALIDTIQDYPDIKAFFIHSAQTLLSRQVSRVNEEAVLASTLINTGITQFYNTPVATIEQRQTIRQAAQKMAEKRFSCLVVTDKGHPVGIVTDKDISRRCVAQGLDTNEWVKGIMTHDLLTLDISANAYDALMLMTGKRIHHLPVTKDEQLVGMVSMTDLVNHEGQNALNITALIHRAKTIDELAELGKLLGQLQLRLEKIGATADHVGKSISAITMAFTTRLIQMYEQLYGPAPVAYAWLGAGSEARREQLAHSDQDNALIIANDMQPEHALWFDDLATFVCDGLAAFGFVYCPGNVMATNEKWRQTAKVWQGYFNRWVDTPSPKALLHSSIFFDMVTVYGDEQLLADIRRQVLEKTRQNTLFIAHLTTNALKFRPPLGFFRDFVLINDGEHKQTMDLKHFGITPIVDLARIYALSEGISATNTIERIQLAAGTPSLSKTSGASLLDAYQFLTTLRLQHQSNRMRHGETPNNYLSPKQLSRLEREHLKAAFKVIKTLQDVRQKTL